jgi:hypothetical protein
MDMLYARYSSPMDLMSIYIHQRRFGDFIKGFIQAENDRKKAEAERDEELKEWIAYVHSDTEKSFNDWRAELKKYAEAKIGSKTVKKAGRDEDLDDKGIQDIYAKLFPGG